MSKKAIVYANHKNQTATLNFVDEENNLIAFTYKNEPLINLSFPYRHIKSYDFLFRSIEKTNEVEKFEFLIMDED